MPNFELTPLTLVDGGDVVCQELDIRPENATLGVLSACSRGEYIAATGGEKICLVEPVIDAGLSIEVTDGNGKIFDSHILTKDKEYISVLGGRLVRLATTSAEAKFVSYHPRAKNAHASV